MAQNGGTWGGTLLLKYMAKIWISAEIVRAGLRHAAVVCPNVTGRTKERIAQSKSGLVLVLHSFTRP